MIPVASQISQSAGMRRDDICLCLSPSSRARLDALINDRNTAAKLVWRAEIVLATADGHGTNEIMRRTGRSTRQEECATAQDEDAPAPGARQSRPVMESARYAEQVSARLVGLLLLRNAAVGVPGGRSLRLRARSRLPRPTAQSGRAWHPPLLLRRGLWRMRIAASQMPALNCAAVCPTMKPVGEPDAVVPHVRFDERGGKTEPWRGLRNRQIAKAVGNSYSPSPNATASLLDSTTSSGWHGQVSFWYSGASRT